MIDTSSGSPQDHASAPLLGPAVSPRREVGAPQPSLAEPLAPFVAPRGEAARDHAAPPVPAEPAAEPSTRLPEAEFEHLDDLPWMLRPEELAGTESPVPEPSTPAWEPAGDLPDYLGGVPEVNLDDDVIPVEALVAEPQPAPESAPAVEVDAIPYSAPEAAEPASVSGVAPEPASAASGEPSGALVGVAERLEGIAAALRAGDLTELLRGSADPLAALVAGYALGLAEGARPGGGEQG
jgi:hypothetical protein